MNAINDRAHDCRSCGSPLELEARFCGSCGAPLGKGVPERAEKESGEGDGRRAVWRWFWGVGTILLIGAVALFGLPRVVAGPVSAGPERFDWAEHALPDPATVPLPAVDERDAAATRSFLQSEGIPLLAFHDASVRLLALVIERSEDAADRCEELVEKSIDPITPFPTRLLALAATIPDAMTNSMLGNDIAAKWDLLSACLEGAPADHLRTLQTEAAFNHALVVRHLAQLGLAEEGEVAG